MKPVNVMRRFGLHVLSAVVLSAIAVSAQGPVNSPVADAASRGDVTAVQALLKQGVDASAAQGDGMTALHWAADRGDAAMAEMLVHAGANVSAGTRLGQYTPLHLASRAGHAAVVTVLLAAGADVSAKTTPGGTTPLHRQGRRCQRARDGMATDPPDLCDRVQPRQRDARAPRARREGLR
jgi:hypothetical protein